MEDEIRDVLTSLGYTLRDNGKEFRSRPIYRDSGNDNSLVIKKDNGFWIDYSENIKGFLPDLVKITLNLKDVSEAKKYLKDNGFSLEIKKEEKPKIKDRRVFPEEYLDELFPNHKYWIDRGISKDTLSLFKGGICSKGLMKNRYVFPIFDSRKKFVGYSGRYIHKTKKKSLPKWLHRGDKSFWKYPLFINFDFIKNSQYVILVESIGDMLALWDAGIKNVMVVFGIDVSLSVLNFLIRLDVEKIVIAFNNDKDNNLVGNKAADKAKNKFLKYFDEGQVIIFLPDVKNDFGDMTKEEIKGWQKKINL